MVYGVLARKHNYDRHVSSCSPSPQFSNLFLFLLVTSSSSKDPYLTSQYAIQFVKGMQFGIDSKYVLNYA